MEDATMAKRNKKSTRRRLAPTPVKGKSPPLPAETRARLAFKLAQARGERLAEAETRADDLAASLQRHRQGGRPPSRVSRALLLRAIQGVTDALRARLRGKPKPGAVYKEVGKQFGRSASWVRLHLRRPKAKK